MFFSTDVHPRQSPRATQGRALLKEHGKIVVAEKASSQKLVPQRPSLWEEAVLGETSH